jgi:type VI secretion system secreted protein Hcp
VAYEFYITIEGSKQGLFKSSFDGRNEKGAPAARKHRIAGIKYLSETTSPRDAATGLASGKRIHKPITITKQWDAASPQLFQALVENETLKSVLFEFVKTNPNGTEEIYHTVTLKNAAVSNIRSYLDLTDTSGDPYDAHELEDVSFVFEKIEIENREGKTAASDDWQV